MRKRRRRRRPIIWGTIIIRRDRDAEMLFAGSLLGDPICRRFDQSLMGWMRRREPTLCLACEHEFQVREAPGTFMLSYSEDPRVKHTIMTGICDRCAAGSDTELLNYGVASISKLLDGEVMGFAWPATRSMH
jgi:hypothetical protein